MSKMMMKTGVALVCLAALQAPEGALGRESGAKQYLAQAEARADTVYRAARRLLNQEQYQKAIELFEKSMTEEPQYTAEALYYQALALYRIGGRPNYERALSRLELQAQRYPQAASRGDAEELTVRIESELARRGDARAAQYLAQEAMDQEADREAELKAMALQALVQMDSEKAIPYLKKVLLKRTPETAELRGQAVFILGQQESPEVLDLMLDVVRNDPEPEVKGYAAFWLSQVDDPRAIDATIAILEDPAIDEDVKGQAVFALGQTDDPRAGRILGDYAARADLDPDVRGMAIHGLASHPSPENAALLKRLFSEIDEPEVREQILFALTQMPDAADGEWLASIFSDTSEDRDVREMALFLASQSGNVDAASLGRMYDSASDREMKEHILFAMTQVDNGAVFDKLVEIARTEQDPELRQNAIFWLGRSGDPRAADVLVQILEE